ncbi:MAG TPA: hypothetical protein VFK80_08615, partial [Limnochordia bacterium]|nr:hypothetical protein [Limnochordia bacterium]
DFYGMTVMPQPDFWLGLLWVFYIREPLAKVMLRRSHNQFHRGFGVYGKVEVQLIFSYDGRYWLRAPGRQPFIPWGERGAFDGGSVYTANAPVEHGDDLYFYYSGTLTEHGDGKHAELHTAADGSTRQAGIGLATIKRDRYASFSADGDGLLEVDHGPLTGGQLSVNAYCPHGFIKAELAGLDGQTLPGFEAEACLPFTGDATAGSLRWREADLAQLADGREVLIRFHMYNADLFAYEIGV